MRRAGGPGSCCCYGQPCTWRCCGSNPSRRLCFPLQRRSSVQSTSNCAEVRRIGSWRGFLTQRTSGARLLWQESASEILFPSLNLHMKSLWTDARPKEHTGCQQTPATQWLFVPAEITSALRGSAAPNGHHAASVCTYGRVG